MNKSQLAEELKVRLSLLFNDPDSVIFRQERASEIEGTVADVLALHNRAVSEEILNLSELSINGTIQDQKIFAFRNCLSAYLNNKGTGYKIYDEFITIICEYQALVVEKPLHPLKIRHFEKEPPEDTDQRQYCCWKKQYIIDSNSLCHFCNCLSWPD